MTDAQRNEHFAKELEHVARCLREDCVGQPEIDDLVNTITVIRTSIPSISPEEMIVSRYLAAKDEETLAAADVGAHFWPLIKGATTEQEARAILNRVPGGCVEKVFFVDHLIYVSKVLPKVERS